MCDDRLVTIIQTGRKVEFYPIENDIGTVGDFLQYIGRSLEPGMCITSCHSAITLDHKIHAGDTIYISKSVKGNLDPFQVEFILLGGRPSITVAAEDGQCLRDIITQLPPEDSSTFIDGEGKSKYEFRPPQRSQDVGLDFTPNRPENGKIRIICSKTVKGNE